MLARTRRMRPFIVLFAICLASSSAFATDTWTTPRPGMRRLHRVTSTQNINALVIDLCAAGISVRATKESEHPRVVSSFGTLVHADAAINANFFNVTTYDPTGPVMGNGVSWGGGDSTTVAPVQFGPYRVALPANNSTAGIEPWATQVVSGHPTLLVNNVARDNTDALCTTPAPRTGVGLSADRQTLYLAVVDGRATTRVGMTCNELASLLKGLGATDAVNLDGGGSSTMWLAASGVINYPSDGFERTVSTHLAIHAAGTGAAPNCPAPRYLATATTEPQALELHAGESTTVALAFTNDGNVAWLPAHTRLGTQDPQDRASAFAASDWLDPTRPAAVDHTTQPADTGSFAFTLLAPDVSEDSTFSETFQLVEDDATWFGPPQIVSIVVHPRDDGSQMGGDHTGCNAAGTPGAFVLVVLAFGMRSRRRQRFGGSLR